jgi:hypothetical protein
VTSEEVRAWVASTRLAQGKPRHVEALDVLGMVAADLRAPIPNQQRPVVAGRPAPDQREVTRAS